MLQGKKLVHYIGKNVKTKVVNLRLLLLFYRNAISRWTPRQQITIDSRQVIEKLRPRWSGTPGREPVLSEERKNLMLAEFRRR